MKTNQSQQMKEQPTARKDAQQNKQTLIQTALELFKTQGPEVSLTDIAKAAQVSRMTCYRNFPDKQALIAAVFQHNLDQLASYAQQLKDEDQAFFKLLHSVVELQMDYSLLLPHMKEEQNREASQFLFSIFSDSVTQAKEANQLRPDFTLEEDLILVLMMMGGAIAAFTATQDKQQAQRALTLLVQGLQY